MRKFKMKTAFLAINKNGEGVVFDNERDALQAAHGIERYSSYAALAGAFQELYPNDNRVIEISIPDVKP